MPLQLIPDSASGWLAWLARIKNDPLIWAQAVHFLLGFTALMLAYREGRRRNFWPVALGVILTAVVIEVWYDPRYEGDPFFWGGFKDLSFYALGTITGLVVDCWGMKKHPVRRALRRRFFPSARQK